MSIAVVGSLNMDLVVRVKKRPQTGETVIGSDVLFAGGGKGANQAIAAARLGGNVTMIGKVGEDPFGITLKKNLHEAGVKIHGVSTEQDASSGMAFITIDEAGDNQIIVAPGANNRLLPADIRVHRDIIQNAKAVLLQLEIPLETVLETAALAKESGTAVILDPAPARPLPSELLQLVDFLTPNEHEAAALCGQQVSDVRSARLAAAKLLTMGCRSVVLKMGEKGVLFAKGNNFKHLPAIPVKAVDTTAAGDAFGAAFAVSLLETGDVVKALRFANATGAITVTRSGAQPSLPQRKEVEKLLQ